MTSQYAAAMSMLDELTDVPDNTYKTIADALMTAHQNIPPLKKDLEVHIFTLQYRMYKETQDQYCGLFMFESNKSVMITMLSKESIAYESGLLPGDILLKVNNLPISSLNQAVRTIKSTTGTVVLTVYRRTLDIKEEES